MKWCSIFREGLVGLHCIVRAADLLFETVKKAGMGRSSVVGKCSMAGRITGW